MQWTVFHLCRLISRQTIKSSLPKWLKIKGNTNETISKIGEWSLLGQVMIFLNSQWSWVKLDHLTISKSKIKSQDLSWYCKQSSEDDKTIEKLTEIK